MKIKHLFTYILTLLLISILIYSCTNINDQANIDINMEEDKHNEIITTIEDITSTIPETNNKIEAEENYLDIILANGYVVNEVIDYEGNYLVAGDHNNKVFLQIIYKSDNNYLYGTENIFSSIEGTIIELKQQDYYLSTKIKNGEEEYIQTFIENNGTFIPFFKKQIQYNYYKNRVIKPEYIVIHETANTAVGANARNHYLYWNREPNANASTHFVVDNREIYQMLELNQGAFHVGDNKGHSDITNFNSIGIEIAVNQDGNFYQARENAIQLTINIMKYLNMDISQLKRHYDASGKNCPTNMLLDDSLWTDFVMQVAEGVKS